MSTEKGKTNANTNAIAIVLGVLLVAVAVFGFLQFQKKNNLQSQNEVMTEQISELDELKTQLESEVDSLQEEYTYLASENEELQGSLSDVEAKLVSSERALRNSRASAAKERNSLKAQIQELIAAKDELQMSINDLQAENDSLRTRTGILEQDLAMTTQQKEALENLNQTIQEEVKALTLANFKASAFQVSAVQRNGKVTWKAGRARQIKVNFDLANVPEEFQGIRPVYLTITDDKGTPIASENPVKATAVVNGQEMNLIAVEAKDVNIGESQRLSFTYDLENKLDEGLYRAAVYTDIGLLGASSFQLR